MFSSNPFQDLPPSIHVMPSLDPNIDHDRDDAYYNYHYSNDPFITEEFLFHSYNDISPFSPLDMEKINKIKQDFLRQQQIYEGSGLQSCEDHDDLLASVVSSSKKKMVASKKNGHSKIYTAGGPRDRRVRLSIGIAKKFFCLQDLLGFDKASKTLDWLFTKSKTAIKDLVEEKKNCSSRFSTVTEVSFLETINGGSDEEDKGQKKRGVDGKSKKLKRKSNSQFQANLARDQSRAEARARARERTREKMRIKNLGNEYLETLVVPEDFDYHVSPSNLTLQSSCWSNFESQNDYKDITWESIMDPVTYADLPNFGAFPEKQGDHATYDLDLL